MTLDTILVVVGAIATAIAFRIGTWEMQRILSKHKEDKMFVYRYYDETDIYNNRYTGYEVGYLYNEYDYQHERNVQKFKRVKSFTDAKEAARYCHYLNGGDSTYYDA